MSTRDQLAIAEATPVLATEPIASARPASLWRDTIGSILRQRSARVGLVMLTFLVLVAVFAPVIATHDPQASLLGTEQNVVKRSGPCIHLLGCPADEPQHIFGTDGNFRDLYSRVVYGARTSLTVGIAAVGFAIIIGTIVGAIAGFAGGGPDNILMRLMDVLLAFPALLLAIAIVTAAGRSLVNALIAIGIVSIPVYARIVRSSVITTRQADFVTASRALGESSLGILFRRIMPNSITPLIVAATLGIGGAVLEIAALAFIGVTGDLSNPEWGSIIGLEKDQIFRAPHLILIPGLAITITVLAFNLLGDGLRDALDPRLNR
ncbi:MAG TPA: ABC transporter permease [Candidatus Limnocylindrales bacterium]|nr:ABC transporter permease [Candidatus Limnocylindrales bacterium]